MKAFKFICSLGLVASFGTAAESPDWFEWITDPEELAPRGFDPDGPPIQRLIIEPDPRPFEEQVAERERNEIAGGTGNIEVTWASVQATDFQLLGDEAGYNTQGNFIFSCSPGSPSNMWADAAIPLPRNRRLRFFDVWTYDTSADHNVEVLLYRACQPIFSADPPVVTELASRTSSGSSGNQFSFVSIPGPIYTQTAACTYWVRARFSSCNDTTALRVQKARVIWD
jgi:hypothetical protein